MRMLAACFLLAVLAACGEAPRGEAEAAEAASISGEFRAKSERTRTETGNVAIQPAGLMFAHGVILYTRTIELRRAGQRIARDGDSFAAITFGAAEAPVELRRVTEQVVRGEGRSLCGEDVPGYVALAQDARAGKLVLLVFAGDEPPGPMATASRLCAVYEYSAAEGVPTHQGVVLW